MTQTTSTFDDALRAYFETAKRVTLNHYKQHYPNVDPPQFELQRLKKYARIVKDNSVHSFVDMSNGDILKPAGWTKPAKHARGSIFSPDHGESAIDWHGPRYLK